MNPTRPDHVRRLAVLAMISEPTARKFLRGENVCGLTQARIEKALAQDVELAELVQETRKP